MVNASLEDPAEAMLMVRDAVLDAGMSFDDMSPAMRRAVAEAAGLEDAGQLASLMAGDLDSLGLASSESAKQMEELKEATKFTQSLADELEATRLSFTANFAPIVELFITVLDWLQALAAGMNEHFGANGAAVVSVIAGASLMGIAFAGLMMTVTAATAPVTALTASLGALNTTLAAAAAGGLPAAGGIKAVDKAAKPAGPSLLSLAASALMVGVGIGAAALGVASLATALGEIPPDRLLGVAVGIIGLGVAFVALGAALMFFANPMTTAALGTMLAIAGAVMLIGAAIGVAAAGMASLVSSVGELAATANDFEKIGKTFEQLDIPKMIVYTAAMSATALVGSTPAAAIIEQSAAAVGSKEKAAPPVMPPITVELTGELKEYALVQRLKPYWTDAGAVTPGGRIGGRFMGPPRK